MELDWNEFDPENPEGGILPGTYHVLVHEADENATASSGKMTLEVLSGTRDNMLGMKFQEYVAKSAAASRHRAMLFIAAGLTTLEQLRQDKADGRKPAFNFADLKGRTFIAEVEHREGRDRPGIKFGKFFACDDPRVADIPKNTKFAQLAASGAPSGGGGGGGGLENTDF